MGETMALIYLAIQICLLATIEDPGRVNCDMKVEFSEIECKENIDPEKPLLCMYDLRRFVNGIPIDLDPSMVPNPSDIEKQKINDKGYDYEL